MIRRWTPQRLVMLRRIRVSICVATVTAVAVACFAFTARKTVALTVNGETTTVTTYAMSVDRLLESQGIDVKTHDLVESTAGGNKLADHAVVTVQSAYQTTITIDGQKVPFWTTATSADQLLGFFAANEAAAAKVTVNISNIYNKLTGGLVINESGPVTVIADGTSSEAPNGKLPAASILDSKGITLNKEDRVSVEKDGDRTILRVQRVTHGQETRTVAVPHGTQTVIDSSLQPGEAVIRQQGEDGETQQVYDVTYVDGVAESENLISETTTKIALDTVVAVGPEQTESGKDTGNANAGNNTDGKGGDGTNGSSTDSKKDTGKTDGKDTAGTNTGKDTGNDSKGDTGTDGNGGNSNNGSSGTGGTGNDSGSSSGNTNGGNASGNTGSGSAGDANASNGTSNDSSTNDSSASGNAGSGTSDGSASARLWRPTAAQAQTYAAGAAAQRGWTGNEWNCLVKLWNRESRWLWYAENPSGAYGIPQSLPGSKMAAFGADWRNDAAVQIDWGLSYIAQRYGSPSQAWAHSESAGWY